MKTIQYELSESIATLTFDEPGSPVNTMCRQWQDDLNEVTAQIIKDKEAIRGIILASAKSTFFAGADLKAVMRLQPADAPRVYAEIERMNKNLRTLETLGKPVVSCRLFCPCRVAFGWRRRLMLRSWRLSLKTWRWKKTGC
jgi:3-hydroxyacyl-CoA dehydrogenase/enoyl-CoA hydratase/3-hydroxybutyryl-CoA epimerase